MRILLADDHAVVRRGLKQILSEAFVDATFGEAENGAQTLAQASQQPWDVIVLDVSMPGRSGLEVLTEIKKQLRLSIKTVSTYRTRILEKMGARNNSDLTRYALTNQLID